MDPGEIHWRSTSETPDLALIESVLDGLFTPYNLQCCVQYMDIWFQLHLNDLYDPNLS